LFVSISQVIGCEDRLRNDLYCVEWGVKLYSNQPSPVEKLSAKKFQNLSHVYVVFLGHGVKVQGHTRIEENVNFRLLKVNVNIGQTSSIKITEKQTVVAGVT